jgi:hypothetical protein
MIVCIFEYLQWIWALNDRLAPGYLQESFFAHDGRAEDFTLGYHELLDVLCRLVANYTSVDADIEVYTEFLSRLCGAQTKDVKRDSTAWSSNKQELVVAAEIESQNEHFIKLQSFHEQVEQAAAEQKKSTQKMRKSQVQARATEIIQLSKKARVNLLLHWHQARAPQAEEAIATSMAAVFDKYDTDGDGQLDERELAAALKEDPSLTGVSEKEISDRVRQMQKVCPMPLNILECQASKMVNSDACPRPTAGQPRVVDEARAGAEGRGRGGGRARPPDDRRRAAEGLRAEALSPAPQGVSHFIGENIRRYPMPLTSLECPVSKLVNSDTCPLPTTGGLA